MNEPEVRKILLIDFDGTLTPHVWPKPPGEPYPGAAEAMRELKRRGYYLVIFTSRWWRGWVPPYSWGQQHEVVDWLLKYDVPYDEITNEKRPCLAILDDLAYTPLTTHPAIWEYGWPNVPDRIDLLAKERESKTR
jgi:phosphoserine phosphatase